MMALGFLFVFIVYLIISILVVRYFVKVARKRNIKGWKFGVPAALIMYSFVFWDYIPTYVLHKYYCATEAGYWVYKTPEQWIGENKNVVSTLKPFNELVKYVYKKDGATGYYMNQRIADVSKMVSGSSVFPVRAIKASIIDVKTNEELVARVRVSSGYRSKGGGGLEEWRFMIGSQRCFSHVKEHEILEDYRAVFAKYENIGSL
ncbi:MAG: hypothetical protein RPU52_10200 [Candidatus Sedimenticola sp. (ex Thyasira tokunagai)]